MILLEFPIRTNADVTCRHVLRLEDLREVIEREDGEAALKIDGRQKPLVVALPFEEVMQKIHAVFAQIVAHRQPQPQSGLMIPNGVHLKRQ